MTNSISRKNQQINIALLVETRAKSLLEEMYNSPQLIARCKDGFFQRLIGILGMIEGITSQQITQLADQAFPDQSYAVALEDIEDHWARELINTALPMLLNAPTMDDNKWMVAPLSSEEISEFDKEPETNNKSFSAYIGLSVKEAYLLAHNRELPIRIVKEDGKYHVVTRDYNPNRINLEIEQDKVIKAYGG